MKFTFNNTYDPGYGFEFEKEFTICICHPTCEKKWTELEEIHEFEVELLEVGKMFQIDVSEEVANCAFTTFGEPEGAKLLSLLQLSNGKLNLRLDEK